MIKALVSLLLFLCQFTLFARFSVENLKVNYESTPLGTDEPTPQFSWQMKSETNERGLEQSAWQIIVKEENQRIVWDTGKKAGSVSHGIQYQGAKLQAVTRYTWEVLVWDGKGEKARASSWFETGLMNPSQSAWNGAAWIGGGDEDLIFYPHYQSVFKLSFGIQLDEPSRSTRASFVFGANDTRLSNKYLNLMAVQRGHNESYVALELDISGLQKTEGQARLAIYRVGYTQSDSEKTPFKTLDIPLSLINKTNAYQKHQIFADCNFGLFEFYINSHDESHKLSDPSSGPAPAFGARGINLNPVGSGNNFISFPMLADMGFKTGEGQKAYFSELTVRHYRKPGNMIFNDEKATAFDGVPSKNGAYEVGANTLVTRNLSRNSAPMLRTEFALGAKKIKKARLYVTARGIYELYLNGKRVGEDYFNPGLTQYNKHHMYQTYDLTDQLKAGTKNALGAWLGEGWWSGNITYGGENWNFFGDRQTLLAQLVIAFSDGSSQIITSNDKDWKLYTEGPVLVGSFFQGEVYDATRETDGWASPGFDDTSWKKAQVVPLEGSAFMEENPGPRSLQLTYDDMQLVAQTGENARVVKSLTAATISEPRSGIFVYDMAQNMVGIPKIQIRNGKKGTVINLRYAEVLYPNLPEYKGNEGMIMLENIRAALSQDRYVLKGGDEIIQPHFTFHGYRYLEISGIEKALPVEDVKGLVISSVNELSSRYSTNNEKVNKLWENITWSLRGNFLSIPTDCNQRNERMGWSGDINVFSKAATFLTQSNSFLRRHLMAMRDIQPPSGRFTDVAPVGGGFGGTLWGSAGVVVAWETWRQYGDIQLLGEHYDAMKKYMAFLETKVNEEGILNEGPLGDWLSPEGNKNDNTLFWMAYFAYDLELMAKMGEALGNQTEAAAFSKRSAEIKKKFNKVYVDQASGKTIKSGIQTGFMGAPNERDTRKGTGKGDIIDTQASYAIPLALGTFDDQNRKAAINHLSQAITRKSVDDGGVERPEYSLMAGFIGTASISEALSENGRDDLAYKLLVNEQYPSWLYSVVNGATTIWERLNSYTVENGFGGNNSMNSFNHYSFGAVAAWMYNYSLGIQRDPEEPGFRHFVLKPAVDPNREITSAEGYYDSMYGRVESAWKQTDGKVTFTFTVPANSSADLYLPGGMAQITEQGKSVSTWSGVKETDGKTLIPLKSGKYTFELKR